ncbi:hypothetical protein CCANI_06060 [Corynebacterium canis]|nr:hypothetical protein CCANI_06060 [Corynebacterium canis]
MVICALWLNVFVLHATLLTTVHGCCVLRWGQNSAYGALFSIDQLIC